MIAARIDGHVRRPPAEVYDLLADVRNEPDWQPAALVVEKETDGPIGAGTVFRGRYRGLGEMRVDLVEAARPVALAFRGEARAITLRLRFTFADADGGTDLHLDAEASLHGVRRVLEPVFAPFFRAELRKRPAQLERALATVEAPAGIEPA